MSQMQAGQRPETSHTHDGLACKSLVSEYPLAIDELWDALWTEMVGKLDCRSEPTSG